MSGILEQMKAQLDAATAAIGTLQAQVAALSAGGAAQAAPVAAASPFGAFGATPAPALAQAAPAALAAAPVAAAPAAVQNVTDQMLLGLIQPYLENDAIKAALGEAMRSMGINSLPETQPHQYNDLYARFQTVIAQFQQQAAAPAAAASII